MQERETNNLFPVFLKLENMVVLIVGGGRVGLEKISAILLQAPMTKIRLVGTTIDDRIRQLTEKYSGIQLLERRFIPADLDQADIVIIAINDHKESERISSLARLQKKLVNAADKPGLCDFYMSSIIQKGHLKVAISTNGKSPTIAKRLKELFNDVLPDELDEVLEHMYRIRKQMKGSFEDKVHGLNELTRELAEMKEVMISRKV
jgi:siroheme synthase-like protein